MFFASAGIWVLKGIVGIIGGTIAARYLFTECFLYFKNEKRELPWPIAGIAGLLLGMTLILVAGVWWVFMQLENKSKQVNH